MSKADDLYTKAHTKAHDDMWARWRLAELRDYAKELEAEVDSQTDRADSCQQREVELIEELLAASEHTAFLHEHTAFLQDRIAELESMLAPTGARIARREGGGDA